MSDYIVGPDGKIVSMELAPEPTMPVVELPMNRQVHVLRGFLTKEELRHAFNEIGPLTFDDGGSIAKGGLYIYRNSRIAWLPLESFVAQRIIGGVRAVTGDRLEHEQHPYVACYGPSEYLDWHHDGGPQSNRRWVAVMELQSAAGGALEIEGHPALELQPGDLCVFSADLLHRATAPTTGFRFSVAMWFAGG